MSEEFKVEIVNPEKSFLVKDDVSEVVVPAFEGEMGILKDHISIMSFSVSYTHLRAHETDSYLVCRLLLV